MPTKKQISKIAARYLLAKIQLAPRNLGLYLKIFRERVGDSVKALDVIRKYLEGYPYPEDLSSYLSAVHKDRYFDQGAFYWTKDLDPEKAFPGLKGFEVTNDRRMLEFFHEQLGRRLNEMNSGLKRLKGLDPSLIRSEYPDYKINVPPRLPALLLTVPHHVKTIEFWISDAHKKIGELLKSWKPGYQPSTGKTEILYHASINARRLAQTGFQSVRPSVEGIGGSSETKSGKPSISFTSDLYIAKEIMRALKEAILIAHGQLRKEHILDWARREGILNRVLDSYRGLRPTAEANHPAHVMALYDIYLSLSKRFNPMFFTHYETMMNLFRSKSIRDVGILVCEVDMTDPHIDYLPAMREYRVPPQDVKKILRIYS